MTIKEVKVKVEGWKRPLTVTVERTDKHMVLCRVKNSAVGKTDGCSWSESIDLSDEEHARNHIKWLGQQVEEN